MIRKLYHKMREVVMRFNKPVKCWLCGKQVPAGRAGVILFKFDVKKVKLKVFHAHLGCAERADLVKHRHAVISDEWVCEFWFRREELADKNGDHEFAEVYGDYTHEPKAELSEELKARWHELRIKALGYDFEERRKES